MIVRYQLQVLW